MIFFHKSILNPLYLSVLPSLKKPLYKTIYSHDSLYVTRILFNKCNITYKNITTLVDSMNDNKNILKKENNNESLSIMKLSCESNKLDLFKTTNIDEISLSEALNNGVNINARNHRGETPLMFAAKCQNLEMVKLFLKHNPSLDAANIYGENALVLSFKNSTLDIAELLIDNGIDINSPDPLTGSTALIESVKAKNLSFTEKLLEKGANIQLRDENNDNALTFAIKNNNANLVNMLMNADLSYKNDKAFKEFMLATIFNDQEAINNFLDKGFNVNSVDINGFTPLMLASITNNVNLVKLLISKNADMNIRDNGGSTALMYAVQNNNIEIIDTILISRSEYDIKNDIIHDVINTEYDDNLFNSGDSDCSSSEIYDPSIISLTGDSSTKNETQ